MVPALAPLKVDAGHPDKNTMPIQKEIPPHPPAHIIDSSTTIASAPVITNFARQYDAYLFV